MKKKNLKNLVLNKKSISNLGKDELTGGTLVIETISCEPVGICGYETQPCITENCGTQNCGTQNCGTNVGCNPTNICIKTVDNCIDTISCRPLGIC